MRSEDSSGEAVFPWHELEGHPRYKKARLIKAGSFGKVALAEDMETGNLVALKFSKRSQVGTNGFVESEVLNHLRLHHPHIVSLNEVFLTEEHLVMVLEYAEGGDLAAHVPRSGLPEEEARWLFLQVLFALEYCHRMNVASRDIKLDNLLLDSKAAMPIVKLCDFGLSHDCSRLARGAVGTPAYMSPEVVAHASGDPPYDAKKADVWSCGVLLYGMLTGKSAFQRGADNQLASRQRLQALFKRILTRDCRLPSSLSEDCKDLLSRMLTTDPAARPSVAELLEHPWCCMGKLSGAEMLQCNDVLEAKQLADPTPAEVLQDVHLILEEACLSPDTPHGSSDKEVRARRTESDTSMVRSRNISNASL